MRTFFVILVLSSVGTFLLTPFVRRLAFRWGAIDVPNDRKVHREPMPRLGGLAVYGGFWLPWAGLFFVANRVTEIMKNFGKLSLALALAATVMLVLGVIDDIRGVSARKKLLVQILVATGLYFGGFRIQSISNPFGETIVLGWFGLPISVAWIVTLTNAINLLDGIDGLAAGVTACIALSLGLINVMYDNVAVAWLTLLLAGACLGFLPYNFSPARIFLGDSGSLFIGMMVACVGILSLFKAATVTFVAAPLVLFGLPLFDTTNVFFGRLLRGKSPFSADKTHIHHRLLNLGLNHSQAAYLLYAVTLALGGLAIVLSVRETPRMLAFGITLVIVLSVVVWGAWRVWVNRQGPNRKD